MRSLPVDTSNALQDFLQGIRNRSVWVMLGWNDVRTRYHRSRLGVFWASLSIFVFVSAIGPIYAGLFGLGIREYTLHLMSGMIIWNYISSIILECGREYVSGANYLVSFQISYFTLLFRVVWRNLIVLCYQMLMFGIFVLFMRQPVSVTWLLVPVGLLLVTLTALSAGLIMSVVATRFRDISELINNILRLVFFVTPIMWMPGNAREIALIMDLNPFFHLVEVFRGPLLNENVEGVSWLVVVVMLLIGWAFAFPLFAKYRSRIAFWL